MNPGKKYDVTHAVGMSRVHRQRSQSSTSHGCTEIDGEGQRPNLFLIHIVAETGRFALRRDLRPPFPCENRTCCLAAMSEHPASLFTCQQVIYIHTGVFFDGQTDNTDVGTCCRIRCLRTCFLSDNGGKQAKEDSVPVGRNRVTPLNRDDFFETRSVPGLGASSSIAAAGG